MPVLQRKWFEILMVGTLIFINLVVLSASAASQCGLFEPISMPGRVTHMVPFADGTVAAIGSSASAPQTPVFRYFDGISWTEQDLPSELDGFAFSAAGGTPQGEAWFAGTQAYSIYEIEVAFVRVIDGNIGRIDKTFSSSGAPIDISASSSDDVWALTSAGDVFRFDGTGWGLTDVPDVFVDQHLNPKGIYAVSPDSVWIAGYGSVGKNPDKGFVQYWDGAAWDIVSTPYDEESHTYFRDIDGSGADDIWIVGEGIAGVNILLHWDGSTWVETDGTTSIPAMTRVMTMEAGNAWAVPIQSSSLFYWDGSSWSDGGGLVFPDTTVSVSLRDVGKADVCDAWLVGDYHDGTAYHPWAARLTAGDVVEPPPPGVVSVHVGAIDISRVRVSGKSYYGQAVVTALDSDMQPVPGAVVTGTFSGPSTEQQVATAGPGGQATFISSTVNRPKGDWCFTVSNISAPEHTYDAGMNTVTNACEGADDGGNNGGGKGKKGGKK